MPPLIRVDSLLFAASIHPASTWRACDTPSSSISPSPSSHTDEAEEEGAMEALRRRVASPSTWNLSPLFFLLSNFR
eukprot:CAMPEP_0113914042 /NCGR_PEP_ID=MMETSP0780_2-20120614/30035_1 /TAXON_ID=652834 /ORGANISM="Palpitomonas bilix" /LENGTH=75 /DNA_ID=CAMNT_0000911613 /DNA_START=34 /DNA_END=257 /DNA_ORIENTATION=- /assembly_acc=CAM_ASM_000599